MAENRCATREVCSGDHGWPPAGQRRTREGQRRPGQMAEGSVRPRTPGNAGRGKGPDLRQVRNVARSRGLAQSLTTPLDRVRRLQTSLQAKAKAEPTFRFYTLWDKVCREDVLSEAYGACCRNGGVAGVDGETFAAIETAGRKRWLGVAGGARGRRSTGPRPLLRVWIPKSNGGQRPLGIPCIRDRVVEMAVLMVLGPIFEADLLPQQFGFRPGRDAKTAVRRAFWHITDHGRTEVVDADLSDYFASIPHGPLMRCVSRRVADGTIPWP